MVIDQIPTLKMMYETKRPLLIANTAQSPMWVQIIGHVKSWVGVPLVVGDEPIAFLMLDKMEPDFYQTQHKERLIAFASQSTLALQHAQLFTEIRRRVSELEALSSASAAFRSSGGVPNVLQAVLQAMVDVLAARVGVVFLLDEGQTAVTSQASYPPDFYPMNIDYALGEGITGYVAQSGQMHISTDLSNDPLRKYKPGEPHAIGDLQSTIALPLISEDGILGVIHLGLATVYEFADDEIHTLKAMCNIVANGLQRIQVMQTLESRVASRTYELETANEQLQELDKLKSKFIADVSHELRTPVANLSIYINLLQNGDPGKWPHYISVLQQQANRLTNLVEATLGLSQLEIGNQELRFGPVIFNNIVEEIVLGHQARAEAFSVQLSARLQPDLPMILGNQVQLAQLITNLITNAINYNQADGQISVETSFVEDEAMICLKVTDSGIGIAQAELPHLFDRFYRGQQTGQSNIPGTGLGLAIVKEIVALHDGRIDVTSQINEGTTFSVFLPVYSTVAAESRGAKSEPVPLLPQDQPMELQVEEKE
jgi:signal transduction histidine kinase